MPGRWKASSPTVQSDAGEYLSYDVAGKSPRVYFTKEKGPHTAWSFVNMKRFSEHKGLVHEQGRAGWLAVEERGFTLRRAPRKARFEAGTCRGQKKESWCWKRKPITPQK